MLIITKVTNQTEVKPESIVIDDTLIDYFHKYTKLRLPNTDHRYISYYLDHLDPYTGCRSTFTQFLQDIEIHGNIQKLSMHINQVFDNIVNYLNEHPSTQTFKNNKFEMEMDFIKKSPYRLNTSL